MILPGGTSRLIPSMAWLPPRITSRSRTAIAAGPGSLEAIAASHTIRGVSFGSPHHHHDVTDSTNLRAKELAVAGAPSGTVVTAAEQTAGRGRGDRVWTAPPAAALLYSAILRPLDLGHLLLPLAVPLAVCEACESLAPVRCEVKWPNDVWIGGRKLGGVLIEARPPEWAVIGIGINLSIAPEQFPADIRWPATSLDHGIGPDEMREALDEALGDLGRGRPRARPPLVRRP